MRQPIFEFRDVLVQNPTSQPITLRRMELNSAGSGAYFIRSGSTPMNVKVAANASATFSISTWGRARDGYLSAAEPVVIQGRAFFRRRRREAVRVALPAERSAVRVICFM
jgi:hypothetical protein